MADEGHAFRCAVVGNAGGGKSILSRAMSSKLDLPLHELDDHLWEDGWRGVPAETFERWHAEAIRGERWVMDGFGTVDSVHARIARCTHVVHVDLPIWLHFSLAAERQEAWRAGTLAHPPGGQSSPPPTKRLFELMWQIHEELTPSIRTALEDAAACGCHVERVDSLARLRTLQFRPEKVFGPVLH